MPGTQPHLDQSIVTVTFEVQGNAKEEQLNVFIQNLLWEKTVRNKDNHCMEVIRLKGLVSIKDKPQQVIVQGVHELYDLEETPVNWKDDTERTNRLVLIGRNLDKDILKQLFIATVTEAEKQWTTLFKEDQNPCKAWPTSLLRWTNGASSLVAGGCKEEGSGLLSGRVFAQQTLIIGLRQEEVAPLRGRGRRIIKGESTTHGLEEAFIKDNVHTLLDVVGKE
uniref:putative COBW domain-containing protein 7 isoform X1 n=1 Tax=Callithrix jacchus TaxID=9483 RepID=UPI0023DD4906|nr:putative COBW domain-containing protein 7 isoform X1 [Callithrix jacchus]XP_054111523.1 putative COBW domain-containing protein 7 isoform X1 [Callithrix jacchus]XP_054111527.1 putative COBW domain-containing protein 7 isoform X1 [Callithrix jacchus]XP_054111534.1 putative COBW domain-containing protein 7 isoform X1 [Callithrix jacchus]XP_054111539.1 putative COBW domain-containing protein 7 isoform X1 [Callithrix jacchus]XP_054111545.1 putative COBW domain-containing protein 7 isoform X1 [C